MLMLFFFRSLTMCKYGVFTRWSCANEPDKNDFKYGLNLEEAKQLFSKHFYDKTINSWEDNNFTPVPDMYTLIEHDQCNKNKKVRLCVDGKGGTAFRHEYMCTCLSSITAKNKPAM